MSDLWHLRRYNCPKANPMHCYCWKPDLPSAPRCSMGCWLSKNLSWWSFQCLSLIYGHGYKLTCSLLQRDAISETAVQCASCHGLLGDYERSSESIKLFKWALSLRIRRDWAWREYKAQNLICAQLLELIRSQAVYKFVAHGGDTEDAAKAVLVSLMIRFIYQT